MSQIIRKILTIKLIIANNGVQLLNKLNAAPGFLTSLSFNNPGMKDIDSPLIRVFLAHDLLVWSKKITKIVNVKTK